MSRIVLEHIDKFYGDNHVLKDINLTIEDGDFMTLLGPSGCGKTTTLRVVSGLEKPQGGKMTMDGRTIRKDAFKECDGLRVPLVWMHRHDDPAQVLGHALLENRDDGVYSYGFFNDTKAGKNAKKLVDNGDVTSLSIYANQLTEKSGNVLHGVIREVSLVLAGANPGAYIDNLSIEHGDGEDYDDGDAIIYFGSELSLSHSDSNEEGQKEEETQKQLQDFLNQANIQVAGRIGVDPSTPVIWLSREAVESAADKLGSAKGDMYVRVCAAGNILSGEVVVSRLEMVGDKVVYPQGTLILAQAISNQSDLALMAFLKSVNRTAQADGVIPNPITGDVGAITSTELSNASEKIRSLGGRVTITARARKDITVAGPVLLDLEIRLSGGLPRE